MRLPPRPAKPEQAPDAGGVRPPAKKKSKDQSTASRSATVVMPCSTFNRLMPSARQQGVTKIGRGGLRSTGGIPVVDQGTIMAGIQFRQLSMAEAERCISEIWTCLEEYQFASPKMSFSCVDASTVSFTIELEDAIAENMLMTRLSILSGGGDGMIGLSPKQRAPRLRFVNCR